METSHITIDQGEAANLYEQYRKHKHYETKLDAEIRNIYRLISRGRTVIRVEASIAAAGLRADGLPKLAIVRADSPSCWWVPDHNGGGLFQMREWGERRNASASRNFRMSDRTFDNSKALSGNRRWRYEAITPLVPLHLRPKQAMQNYHILWEAEWSKRIPYDPFLLRRLGNGDAWLVLAAWDLTEVERAVLAQTLNG